MENEVVRRLMWAGLMAATGALATVLANRVATVIWVRVFGEDPPE
jgi:2-iminoacetate synthase ThiH